MAAIKFGSSLQFRPSALVPMLFATAATALAIVLVVAGTSPGKGAEYFIISLNTSRVATQTIKFTPTDASTNSDSGGLFGPIGNFLGGLINNLTSTVDSGLQNVEEEIIHGIIDSVGIKDEYNLFLRGVCEGTLTNQNNPASAQITACGSYQDSSQGFNNVTSSLPSSVVIGTTNVSVPLLASVSTAFQSLQNVAEEVTTVLLAFVLIGLCSSALLIVLSLVSVIVRPNFLVIINLGLAVAGFLGLLLAAIISTILAKYIVSLVNELGEALTLSADSGNRFITVVWVSMALSAVVMAYWFAVWFVEVRKTAFQRRRRTPDQIGNWRGIWGEIWSDLRTEKKDQ